MTEMEMTRSRTGSHPARGWIALGAAAFGGLAVWGIAEPLAGIELVAAGQHVGPVSIVLAALVAGGVAWLLQRLLRRVRHGVGVWTAIGCTVLVLSLAGPLLSGATGTVLVALEAMHVVVGATLIVGLLGIRDAAPRSVGTDHDAA